MDSDEMVAAAIEVAEDGMAAGELPIGAVVVMGGEIVGRSFTRDAATGRRLVHADLLAMTAADERLTTSRHPAPLRLAVNLEPCLMCLGAAMNLGVREVYFGLESPGDGAAGLVRTWQPAGADMPWFRPPSVVGGIRRDQVQEQFRRYCETAPDSGFRRWAQTLVDLPASGRG
jgi:tRNA(adenine34) deaminase